MTTLTTLSERDEILKSQEHLHVEISPTSKSKELRKNPLWKMYHNFNQEKRNSMGKVVDMASRAYQ